LKVERKVLGPPGAARSLVEVLLVGVLLYGKTTVF
jgi:hypothetical protein